jgi:YD repeat-containing protein
MLEPAPFVISADGGGEPEVAFDGRNHLVVWSGPPGGIAAALVSPEGYVLGPPVVLPTQDIPIGPDVAASGSGFLVTWQEVSRSGTSFVRAARIDPDGALLDPAGILLASSAGAASVASDGAGYLVTWTGGGVHARRVGSDGSLPGAPVVVSADGGNETSVAWNGQRYLVAWTRFDAGADSVRAARVTGSGAVQDPAGIPVASGPGSRSQPVVAGNGPFLVAWREQDGDRPDGLHGVRIGDDGVVRDATAIAISVLDGEREPSLSRSAGGDWAVTYTRFRPESPYAADRVFLRTVAPK